MAQIYYPDFQDTVPLDPVQLLDIGHPRMPRPRSFSGYGMLLLFACAAGAVVVLLCIGSAARWALA